MKKTNNKLIATIALLLVVTGAILIGCTKEGGAADAAAYNSGSGKGGSLARFTIAGDYLYAVENHYLHAYSLKNAAKPEKVYTSQLSFDIETIYPYYNKLFLGTKTGLYIYSIDTPDKPQLIGEAKHARSCDPVVANDSVAFVTLKGNSFCGPATSGLYIHDIKNIMQPALKKTIELPDPVGLGLQDSVLYVCCGTAGLKVFNISQPFAPALISTKTDGRYVDVIPYDNVLICFVQDGIVLYDITKRAEPVLIKKIAD